MIKSRVILFAAVFFATQLAFADEAPGGKACGMIAKSCLKAGYTRNGSAGKQFWNDCMKPIMLGKSIQGISIDAATAKECRSKKIDELKQDLKDFQSAS